LEPIKNNSLETRDAMKKRSVICRLLGGGALALTVACTGLWWHFTGSEAQAAPPWVLGGRFAGGWAFDGREQHEGPNALAGTWYRFPGGSGGYGSCSPDGFPSDVGGSWFWMRSPEQEKVVVSSLYSRYCIRCHAVNGEGVWDIPGVPNFANPRWQASRSDDQIARIIIEGRGAVMPTFRGALTLEEAFAMARYLRSFVPGTEILKPDLTPPEKLNFPRVDPKKVK
jgi:mono/diheme cytochrome c family protein